MKKFLRFLFYLLTPFVISGVISFLIPMDRSYYESLSKPFSLPPIVFVIVWSILYLVMGLSMYLFTKKMPKEISSEGLRRYYLQLFFNVTWMVVFFGFKSRLLSVFWTISLWFLVLRTFLYLWRNHKGIGLMWIPYLLWTSFALYLTVSIYFMNIPS